MSISEEIERTMIAKVDLAAAIAAQGVEVPEEARIDEYAALVGAIKGGSESYLYNVSNFAHSTVLDTVTITWLDPDDADWAGTLILVKQGSYPTSERDAEATVVVDSNVRNQYATSGYTMSGFTDGTWFFQAFPYSNQGAYTNNVANRMAVFVNTSLQPGSVFGVEWDYSNESTALTRLTVENDPNGYVDVDITEEPVSAVGDTGGSSPFNAYMPWAGMGEYNVINNAISYRKGEDGFSRTDYDTVVRIPKFWYKIETDEANSKMRFYIANAPKDGFKVHDEFARGDGVERDNIYVGRYHTVSGYYSKSGANPLTGITRDGGRTGSAAKGASWWQYDYATLSALQLLYLVEFADFNSQAKIGAGNVSSGTYQKTGGTDSMVYHTGRAAGTDGFVQAQYRGVEEMWSNVYTWVDGINFKDRTAYVCTNPYNFADDTAENYTDTEQPWSTSWGYIKRISASAVLPWVLSPTEAGGSETTYVPDYYDYSGGWQTLYTGGYMGAGAAPGVFSFNSNATSSTASAAIGTRLIFLP